ncbi:hypothetical protein AB0E08_40555 [Streptomyces sp. NPDC048281]|uniref:hypothetical protein n=1 Tax=Streptomyces sp. NPDC048281 TaxID=3154715 RepID=UPI00342B2BAE
MHIPGTPCSTANPSFGYSVRVKYPHLADLAAGDSIRFRIKGTDETCEVNVTRVTEYPDFEALLDGEGPASVNPTAPRDEQLSS